MLSASLTHGSLEALSSSSWSTATKSTQTQSPGQGPNPTCHTPVRTFKAIKGVLVATREDTGRTQLVPVPLSEIYRAHPEERFTFL